MVDFMKKTNNNNNVTKKTDLFTMNKSLAKRVIEFINCDIEAVNVKTIYGDKKRLALASLNDCKKSIERGDYVGDVASDKLAEAERNYNEAVALYNDKVAKIEAFTYSADDIALYKNYATERATLSLAILKWFNVYRDEKSDAIDDGIVNTLYNAVCDYTNCANVRAKVNSNYSVMLTNTRSKGNFLKVFYSALAQILIASGTAKIKDIDPSVRAKYAPKEKTQ